MERWVSCARQTENVSAQLSNGTTVSINQVVDHAALEKAEPIVETIGHAAYAQCNDTSRCKFDR